MPNKSYNYDVSVFKTVTDTPAPCGDGSWVTTPAASTVKSATTDNVTDGGGITPHQAGSHVPVLVSATKDPAEVTSKVNLVWQDWSETEQYFVVERCTVGTTCPTFTAINSTVAANSTTYSDLAACQGTYKYRIKATQTTPYSWTSNPSNEIEVTTNTMTAPSGLTWNTVGSNEEQVKLTWTAGAGTRDEDAYEIWRCTGSGCSNFALVNTVGVVLFILGYNALIHLAWHAEALTDAAAEGLGGGDFGLIRII